MKSYSAGRSLTGRNILPICGLITAATVTLSGCMSTACLDASIEREPRIIAGENRVEFHVDGEIAVKTFTCEAYYDAHCSVRGNWWSVRETGTPDSGSPSRTTFNDIQGKTVSIATPSCKLILDNSQFYPSHFFIEIDGQNYVYLRSEQNARIYQLTPQRATEGIVTVGIDLDIYVNGKSVVWR